MTEVTGITRVVSPAETLRLHEERVARAYDETREKAVCGVLVNLMLAIEALHVTQDWVDCAKFIRKSGLTAEEFLQETNARLTKFKLGMPKPNMTATCYIVTRVRTVQPPAPSVVQKVALHHDQTEAFCICYSDEMEIELLKARAGAGLKWEPRCGTYYAKSAPTRAEFTEYWIEPINDASHQTTGYLRFCKKTAGCAKELWSRYPRGETLEELFARVMASLGIHGTEETE